ncbi:hypothetical protein K435DRAFT_793029 [Dendrothele bispora CBS 962.96]|uniref:DUF6533 domain-containing protein n=1 Tax=Dendrothele bispora (strain CBS 962.96) TaxID=1314807 RepID=A0A4S8MGM2_DENBC|nr:hypothetical protein K435DRAFT_793029 [Dendrothele bispora CBS 962.96]
MEKESIEEPLSDLFTHLYKENIVAVGCISGLFHESSTLLVYDYLLSIQEENELIWSSKWTWMKVLYIIQRYMPLGDTVTLLSTAAFKRNPTPEFCRGLMTTSTLILAFRVWAICKTSRHKFKLSISLLALFLLTHTPMIGVTALFSRIHGKYFNYRFRLGKLTWFIDPMSVKLNTAQILAQESSFHQQAGKLQPISCILSSNEEHISSIAFFLSLVYQIGIISLTLVPGIHAYKNRKFSPMFKVVYRNGLVVNLIFIGT